VSLSLILLPHAWQNFKQSIADDEINLFSTKLYSGFNTGKDLSRCIKGIFQRLNTTITKNGIIIRKE
jgi:hypothetical protein